MSAPRSRQGERRGQGAWSGTTATSTQGRPRVLADVDTGIDDALALIYLARRQQRGEIELAVTTTAGNTTARLAARNSREVLRCVGAADVSVTAGAPRPRVVDLTTTPETHGSEGFGDYRPTTPLPAGEGSLEEAVAAWDEARPTHVLVAGPATTLAAVVERAPDLLRDVHVTLMAGAFLHPGNTTPTAEWNAWVDPHALRDSLATWPSDSPLPTLCPLNVTERVLLTPERLSRWTRCTDPQLATLMTEALAFYFRFHESVGVGYCAQLHDLAAAQVLLGAVDFTTEARTVEVAVEGIARGTTLSDDGSYWGRSATCRVLTDLVPEAVFAEMERALD